GDVLVASSIGSTETDEIVELTGASGVAELLESAGLRVRIGTIVSAPAIVSGAPARAHAARAGALAVDMESLWCAPLARRHPFAVVRTVLDVPGRELRSFATPLAARKAFRSLVVASRALAHWTPEAVYEHPLEEVGEP
ncbi:MAG: hpnH, partial [Acidimicrobiaceae bacterium]|nr:hpnH [Acidimicrobiaceae bacterium]